MPYWEKQRTVTLTKTEESPPKRHTSKTDRAPHAEARKLWGVVPATLPWLLQ